VRRQLLDGVEPLAQRADRSPQVTFGFQADAEVFSPSAQLTPREREILQLVSEGRTNPAIAEALKIGLKAVGEHCANLMAKLDVHDPVGPMCAAIEQGLILLEK
jgi:DNA-binding NarL/FixJ family response regulator